MTFQDQPVGPNQEDIVSCLLVQPKRVAKYLIRTELEGGLLYASWMEQGGEPVVLEDFCAAATQSKVTTLTGRLQLGWV